MSHGIFGKTLDARGPYRAVGADVDVDVTVDDPTGLTSGSGGSGPSIPDALTQGYNTGRSVYNTLTSGVPGVSVSTPSVSVSAPVPSQASVTATSTAGRLTNPITGDIINAAQAARCAKSPNYPGWTSNEWGQVCEYASAEPCLTLPDGIAAADWHKVCGSTTARQAFLDAHGRINHYTNDVMDQVQAARCAKMPNYPGWTAGDWGQVCENPSAEACLTLPAGVTAADWYKVCGNTSLRTSFLNTKTAAATATLQAAVAQLATAQRAQLVSAGRAGAAAASAYAENAAAQATALATKATKSYALPILAGVAVLAGIGIVLMRRHSGATVTVSS